MKFLLNKRSRIHRWLALLGSLGISAAFAQQPNVNSIFPAQAPIPGGIAYYSSNSTLGSTAAGTTGQVLQSNGPLTPPSWAPPGVMLLGAINLGSDVNIFSTATGQQIQWTVGTNSVPNAQPGPVMKLSNTEAYTTPCNLLSIVSNQCNSTLVVQTTNTSADIMQVTSGYFVASSNAAGPGAVGVQGIGVANSTCSGGCIGTGAFIQGISNTTNAGSLGMELRSSNETSVNGAVSYTGLGRNDDLWLTAQSNGTPTSLSSALHVGVVSGSLGWAEGLTCNSSAIVNYCVNDQSSGVASFMSGGTHTAAFETNGTNTYAFISGPTAGWMGVGTLTPGGTLDVEGGTAAASTNGANITLAAQNAGSGTTQTGGTIFLEPGTLTGSGAQGKLIVQPRSGGAGIQLQLNGLGTTAASQIQFENGSPTWQLNSSTGANPPFTIFDNGGGRNVVVANEAGTFQIMPTTGNTGIGNSTGTVSMLGTVSLTSVVNGSTAANYVCTDSSKNIVIQVGAC